MNFQLLDHPWWANLGGQIHYQSQHTLQFRKQLLADNGKEERLQKRDGGVARAVVIV